MTCAAHLVSVASLRRFYVGFGGIFSLGGQRERSTIPGKVRQIDASARKKMIRFPGKSAVWSVLRRHTAEGPQLFSFSPNKSH
jgi:hypothetical protein